MAKVVVAAARSMRNVGARIGSASGLGPSSRGWRRARFALLFALLSPTACSAEPKPARYGMNLPTVNYWTPGQIFIDQLRSASGWFPMGGPRDSVVPLDADGAPTGYAPGSRGTGVMVHFDVGQIYEVTYKAKGHAHIQVNAATILSDRTGKLTVRYNGPDPIAQVTYYSDGALPADLHIVRQDRAAAFAAGEQFAPDMLDGLKGFSVVRSMDWTQTNGSPRTDMLLADTKATYANGVPLAVIVALANRTGARPWINLPHLISDDGARAAFAYLKANLKPGIAPIIEYSNEVWNTAFPQAKWAAQVSQKPGDGGFLYGFRSGQLAQIARESGFKIVLMGQFVTPFRFANIYSGFQASGARDGDVEATGAADYITGTLNDSSKPDGPNLMAANDIDGALANVAAGLSQSKQFHTQWGGIAKAHGWKYWTYEGANYHLNTLSFGDKRDVLAAFYKKVQMDPRAGDLVSRNTDMFQAAGGEIETVYNWSSPSGRDGFFGVLGTPTLAMMKARMAVRH